MRQFIRHPSCIPIDIAIDEPEPGAPSQEQSTRVKMTNVSTGGLAFRLLHPVLVGAGLTISMPEIWPDYSATGKVVWCSECDTGEYEAGVKFDQPDEAFKARMVAQYCHIEDYRREVRERDGRELSSDEAAREWITRYAEEFADSMGWQ